MTVIRRAHFTMRRIAIKKQVIAFVQRIEEAGFATNVQLGIGEHHLNAKVILTSTTKNSFSIFKTKKKLFNQSVNVWQTRPQKQHVTKQTESVCVCLLTWATIVRDVRKERQDLCLIV